MKDGCPADYTLSVVYTCTLYHLPCALCRKSEFINQRRAGAAHIRQFTRIRGGGVGEGGVGEGGEGGGGGKM